ncbi:MAG: protein arginine kinase [Candidatus Omnitrophota bacterium]
MFEDFLTNSESWLNGKGISSDIVFSSRIRLARNICDFPFPWRSTKAQCQQIMNKIKDEVFQISQLKDSLFIDLQATDELDKQFLLERHLISQEHMVGLPGRAVIVSKDESFSFMVNEEDHLRLQVMKPGFDLNYCWQQLNGIDDKLASSMAFAYLDDIGYLTSCPTNVGTALRASCMLRLPALVLTKRINKILELLSKISFTTRGLFGEGTQAYGDFFQISNQVSLGLTEEELIDNLSGVVNQIKSQEVSARDTLLTKYKLSVQDSVFRALGILQNAMLITTKEALSHLSMLSLGMDLGIIKDIRREVVNNLFITIQPAHLQKTESKVLKDKERRFIRANIIRGHLKN